jgi:hypothetical protein
VKFQQLIDAVQECQCTYGGGPGVHQYQTATSPGHINWAKISNQDSSKILDFLNTWGRCRLRRALIPNLTSCLIKIVPFLKSVQPLNLEDAQLDSLVEVGRERLTISRVIHWSFDELMNVQGFGPVPASKTLHIVAPDLFVMWDNAICQHYRMRPCAYDYTFKFLPKMKAELDEAVHDVTQAGCSRREAIERIRQQGQRIWGFRESIAKLVDEYNWMTCHQ